MATVIEAVQKLQDEVTAVSGVVDSAVTFIGGLQSQLSDAKASLATANDAAAKSAQDLADALAKITTEEGTISADAATIADLQAQIATLQGQIQDTTTATDTIGQIADTLETKKVALAQAIAA